MPSCASIKQKRKDIKDIGIKVYFKIGDDLITQNHYERLFHFQITKKRKLFFILKMCQYQGNPTHRQRGQRLIKKEKINARHRKRMMVAQVQPQMEMESRLVEHLHKNPKRRKQEQRLRLTNSKSWKGLLKEPHTLVYTIIISLTYAFF